MAERNLKVPENLSGPFYVDGTCIDCDMCRSNAPEFFSREPGGGYSFVHRQPSSPPEVAQAEAALQDCPTGSIGNDGA